MVINELLPNPAGRDTTSEFIELLNDGVTEVNLAGYILKDKSGKTYSLRGFLKSGDYLVLPYSLTKLNINNTGEAVFMYDPSGRLIDKAEFLLQPKEGASWARRADGTFALTDSVTPGTANQFKEVYPRSEILPFKNPGETILPSLSNLEMAVIMFVVPIFVSLLSLYILKHALHPKEYIL